MKLSKEKKTIDFADVDINSDLTEDEGGAFVCSDGEKCFTLMVETYDGITEILLTENELKQMLEKIEEL